MNIRLNGERKEIAPDSTVASLIGLVTGVAVAVDREVIPRSEWASTPLLEGQAVEVVSAAPGG